MTTTDTTLFDKKAAGFQYGAQHKMSTSLSFNALKYFNITPHELW
jgi:hypothetical protein